MITGTITNTATASITYNGVKYSFNDPHEVINHLAEIDRLNKLMEEETRKVDYLTGRLAFLNSEIIRHCGVEGTRVE
jgi:hypothetical protein